MNISDAINFNPEPMGQLLKSIINCGDPNFARKLFPTVPKHFILGVHNANSVKVGKVGVYTDTLSFYCDISYSSDFFIEKNFTVQCCISAGAINYLLHATQFVAVPSSQ